MNELKIFKNKELGLNVRMMPNPDGSISINAEDTAIGFGWRRDKGGKNYVMWDRFNGFCEELGFPHKCGKDTYIPESLFYRLGMKASNATAENFQNWLAMDVIPSIRKTGGYDMKQPQGKELLALAVLEAQKTIEEQTAQIEEMKPHAILGQAITTANTSILVGDLAKILRQNGVDIGAQRLFGWMRENGYLIKRKGSDWNLPTQKSMDMGLFEIKESVHIDGNGCNKISRTPKVTGKGQQYFINKFLSKAA